MLWQEALELIAGETSDRRKTPLIAESFFDSGRVRIFAEILSNRNDFGSNPNRLIGESFVIAKRLP